MEVNACQHKWINQEDVCYWYNLMYKCSTYYKWNRIPLYNYVLMDSFLPSHDKVFSRVSLKMNFNAHSFPIWSPKKRHVGLSIWHIYQGLSLCLCFLFLFYQYHKTIMDFSVDFPITFISPAYSLELLKLKGLGGKLGLIDSPNAEFQNTMVKNKEMSVL